jgi:hypothetical protein
LAAVPIASADRVVSVGYSTPSALHGLQVVSRVSALRTAEVRLSGLRRERALRARPGIRFVQRTVRRSDMGAPSVPLSTGFAVPQWQWSAVHADLVPLWVQQAARDVTIAVIDTGADVLAPSLAEKSPVSWNVVNSSAAVRDTLGHGTFVASLAAGAVSDPTGMSGFGGEARLMIVQANRGNGFSDIDEANAIVYAVDHSADIINLSLGGGQTSLVERHAIDYATQHGVLLVAAAGNSAEQGNPTIYPAALLGRSGLVVGASDAGGARASFSTTGVHVDVLAPGVDVLGALASGIPTGFFIPAATPGAIGTYAYGTGTSFAAPEVAGAAALVWAANPKLDAAGVAATLEATAAGQGLWTTDSAFGAIDIASAVERAAGGAPPTVDLVGVADRRRPFRTQRCDHHRHACANVGARHALAVELGRACDDDAVRIAEDDPRAHRHELVDEEQPTLEHLLEDQHGASRLRGDDHRDRREVGGESRPRAVLDLRNRAAEIVDDDELLVGRNTHPVVTDLDLDPEAPQHGQHRPQVVGRDALDRDVAACDGCHADEASDLDVLGRDRVRTAE